MTTPQDINAALDEISEALQTLLDNCSRKAYDDLGKIHQSAQSRVDDLRELQSHVAAHDVVDLEAIKRELRGVIFPYSAVEKVIDHLAARGLLRTTPEDAKGDEKTLEAFAVIFGGEIHPTSVTSYESSAEEDAYYWRINGKDDARCVRVKVSLAQQPEHDKTGGGIVVT